MVDRLVGWLVNRLRALSSFDATSYFSSAAHELIMFFNFQFNHNFHLCSIILFSKLYFLQDHLSFDNILFIISLILSNRSHLLSTLRMFTDRRITMPICCVTEETTKGANCAPDWSSTAKVSSTIILIFSSLLSTSPPLSSPLLLTSSSPWSSSSS